VFKKAKLDKQQKILLSLRFILRHTVLKYMLQGCNHGEELLFSGGKQALKGIPPVAVIVGKTYVMVMAMVMMMMTMVMISHRRMNDLLYLYLKKK